MVGGRVVLFSAFALIAFVYSLLLVAQPGGLDNEVDPDTSSWGTAARSGTAFAIALVFTVIAVAMINV